MYGDLDQNEVPKWIDLSERVTKTRRGSRNDEREVQARVWRDEENENCPVLTIMEYQRRKTVEQQDPKYPFFLCCKTSAEENPKKEAKWYKKTRAGINNIGKLPKDVFTKLGVNCDEEKVSATSYRKLLAQCGADGEVSSVFLSKMMGQKNLDSKLSYTKNQKSSHQAAALVITRRAVGKSEGTHFPEMFDKIQKSKKAAFTKEKKNCSEMVDQEDPSSDDEEDQGLPAMTAGTSMQVSHRAMNLTGQHISGASPSPHFPQMLAPSPVSPPMLQYVQPQMVAPTLQTSHFMSSQVMQHAPMAQHIGWSNPPGPVYQQMCVPAPFNVYQQPQVPVAIPASPQFSYGGQLTSTPMAPAIIQTGSVQQQHLALRNLTNVPHSKKGGRNVKNPGFVKKTSN